MCPFDPKHKDRIIKKGFFPRKNGRAEKVQRYFCKRCQKYFSDQTNTLTYRERKPHINQVLLRMLAGGVSQSEAAYMLDIHPRTVANKLIRFGRVARIANRSIASRQAPAKEVIFDEMETFEHTKMKPLSIGIAVTKERHIIAAKVARMPAKGLLAHRSRRKYGPRKDLRPKMMRALMQDIKKSSGRDLLLKSDMNPAYKNYVAKVMPYATYEQSKGIRGCVVGQGELKATAFDPLFSLNHTCAMYRDRVKRLSRRTWCTTKVPERLQDFVDVYAYSHNERIKNPKVRVTIANLRCS